MLFWSQFPISDPLTLLSFVSVNILTMQYSSRSNKLFPFQVFNEIRNEHFSNVFGFLSQKARNLQTAYDVSCSTVSCTAQFCILQKRCWSTVL